MLDDAERHALEETERALTRADPDLDRLLREGHSRRQQVIAWVGGVVGALLVIGLLWLALPGQALIVATLTTLLVLRYRVPLRRPRRG
ncbi:hypothetical protein Acsp06_37420 [Actinomycetospora sp. NBRC 106375]|uniref:DUF3040 domain-containing protein n=1 Tax=Actinomycetospora sp. NBRC 106375 TaxID=3032207 RepID=UPI0024A24AC0|nr:DUF3040 domain-containing protein [Actinomycetospora sp. NBRC 106375]GLZ47557.1 hypothetical protein Acsp06_37420 [Actinomycetospora sp. NBRC 106375]